MTKNLKQLIEYIDLKIRKAQEELEYLKIVRDFLEYKLSVEPSEEELPAILSEVNWRRYPSGSGEWCFADQIPRTFLDKLKKEKHIQCGEYIYMYKILSGGKEIVSRKPSSEK